jgi:hypothetical protein
LGQFNFRAQPAIYTAVVLSPSPPPIVIGTSTIIPILKWLTVKAATEKSYLPFVKARQIQIQLQDSVRDAWSITEEPAPEPPKGSNSTHRTVLLRSSGLRPAVIGFEADSSGGPLPERRFEVGWRERRDNLSLVADPYVESWSDSLCGGNRMSLFFAIAQPRIGASAPMLTHSRMRHVLHRQVQMPPASAQFERLAEIIECSREIGKRLLLRESNRPFGILCKLRFPTSSSATISGFSATFC